MQLVRSESPEELELRRKRQELAGLEQTLAAEEETLATLKVELSAFEAGYMQVVGPLMVELDDLVATKAELRARLRPGDSESNRRAQEFRQRANQSRETYDQAPTGPRIQPSASLKQLYREVARRVHPDLAADDQDRERRARVMVEVNRAYEQGDEDRLRALLVEWETGSDSLQGHDIGADLVRVIRNIAQVQTRIRVIAQEIDALKKSDLYVLKAQSEEAMKQGRNLLEEMAALLRDQIENLRRSTSEIERETK